MLFLYCQSDNKIAVLQKNIFADINYGIRDINAFTKKKGREEEKEEGRMTEEGGREKEEGGREKEEGGREREKQKVYQCVHPSSRKG